MLVTWKKQTVVKKAINETCHITHFSTKHFQLTSFTVNMKLGVIVTGNPPLFQKVKHL